MKSRIVDASYNVHGTRSVQRLIQVCNEPDMVQDIMDALRGHIAALSSHSNGNHVIQRCLQHMPEGYRVYVFEGVVKSCVEVGIERVFHLDFNSSSWMLRGSTLFGFSSKEVS